MATDNNKRWSQKGVETSNALDLEKGVFSLEDPKAAAESLKRSVAGSLRRKSPPLQSAISMLNFYINRARRNLPQKQRDILDRAK
jgi:hypothetical protein